MAKRKTAARKPTPKKNSGGSNIFMLLVGILLGIVIAFGGVAGGGYYFATNHGVKSTMGIVDKYADIKFNYSDYIAEEYASKTYVELVLSLSDVAKELSGENANLNTLKKLSPYVDKVVDSVLKAADDAGLHLNKEEFMAVSFKNYPTYLKDEASELELGGLLDTLGVKPSPLLKTVCYGVENVDYIEDEDGKIIMLGGAKKTTINDFMTGGLDGVIEEIPLDALIDVEPSSSIEMSLFYGKSNRYDYNPEKGVADMRQMSFTKIGDDFYDIDSHHADVSQADGFYTITDGEETYYLLQETTTLSSNSEITYLAWRDKEGTLPARYPKTTVGDMQHDTDGLINSIELGELFGVSPLDEDADELLLSIAYGEKGTHYELVDKTGDGKPDAIVWLPNGKGEKYTANTIATLMEDDGLMSLMNDVKLGTVLGISPLDPYQGKSAPDEIMLLLAYGEEDVHYRLTDTDNNQKPDTIEWLTDERGEKYSAKTIGDLTDSDESMFNAFSLATVLDVDGSSAGIMKAIAFGSSYCYTVAADGKTVTMNAATYTLNGGKAYDYRNREVGSVSLTDSQNGVYTLTKTGGGVQYLKATDGVYYAYATADLAASATATDRIKYQKRTLEDLMGAGAQDIINEIELAVVLDITPESDPIMIALAYGKEGTDFTYIVENGKKVDFNPINPPKTIYDLQNDKDLFNNIELATVLNITPDSEPIMIALAYGKEGTDFTYIVEGGKKVGFNPINAPKTIYDLQNDTAIFDNIELATVLNITPESQSIMIALAYGKEGTDFTYIVEGGKKVGFNPITAPKTIGDLKNDPNVFNGIELAAIFEELDATDKIMMFLLYGKEGIHYTMDGTTPVPMQRRIAVYNGVPYDVYGKPMPGASISGNIFTDVDGKTYTMTLVADGTATQVLLHADSLSAMSADEEEWTEIYATYYYLSDANGKVYFQSRTLGDLTQKDSKVLDNMTYALTVADVLRDDNSIEDNFLLKHVADVVIADLPDRIMNLTFKEVYAKDIYHRETIDGVTMYQYKDANGDIQYVQTIYYNREEHEYYSTEDFQAGTKLNLVLEPAWEYLLTEEDHVAHDYKITEFEQLITNMKYNVQNATLFDLYDHGLIEISEADGGRSLLEDTMPNPDNFLEQIPIGSLTITGLIKAISML